MSPTKASLARFNPNLLPRSASAEPRRQSSTGVRERSRRARTTDHVVNSENGNNAGVAIANLTGVGNAPNGGQRVENGEASPAAEDTPSKLPRPKATMNTAKLSTQNQAPATPTHKTHQAVAATGLDGDGEPSLPSTPSQLGLEPPPEKPKGLLFHTPSKRPHRKDRLTKKTSPLKPRDPLPQPAAPTDYLPTSKLGRRVFIDSVPKPPPSAEEVGIAVLRKSLQQLESRLKSLQGDLTSNSMLSRWYEDDAKWKKRLGKQKKEVSKEASKVLKLQAKCGDVAVEDTNDKYRPHIQTVTERLAQFLPFQGRRLTSTEKIPPVTTQETEEGPNGKASLTVKVLSSSVQALALNNPISVRHDLEISIPQHTKIAKLKMSINPLSQVVSSITVLEMIAWAAPELSPWLNEGSVEKTPASIGKAIGRYLEVSRLRARCWSQCISDFPALAKVTVDDASLENEQFANYGAKRIQFSRSSTKWAIQWHITLSDAGDVTSSISSETTLPDTWTQLDGADDLGKVDEAFHGVMRESGVTAAIRIIAKILFPP